MSDVEVTIKLPEELVERARAVGVEIEAQTDQFVAVIEAQVRKREAARRLKEITEQLHALPDSLKPTPEEIDAEVRDYWAEKAARDSDSRDTHS